MKTETNDSDRIVLHCPHCFAENTLKSTSGIVPITQDLIHCTACKWVLNSTQLAELEDKIVRERLSRIGG